MGLIFACRRFTPRDGTLMHPTTLHNLAQALLFNACRLRRTSFELVFSRGGTVPCTVDEKVSSTSILSRVGTDPHWGTSSRVERSRRLEEDKQFGIMNDVIGRPLPRKGNIVMQVRDLENKPEQPSAAKLPRRTQSG